MSLRTFLAAITACGGTAAVCVGGAGAGIGGSLSSESDASSSETSVEEAKPSTTSTSQESNPVQQTTQDTDSPQTTVPSGQESSEQGTDVTPPAEISGTGSDKESKSVDNAGTTEAPDVKGATQTVDSTIQPPVPGAGASEDAGQKDVVSTDTKTPSIEVETVYEGVTEEECKANPEKCVLAEETDEEVSIETQEDKKEGEG